MEISDDKIEKSNIRVKFISKLIGSPNITYILKFVAYLTQQTLAKLTQRHHLDHCGLIVNAQGLKFIIGLCTGRTYGSCTHGLLHRTTVTHVFRNFASSGIKGESESWPIGGSLIPPDYAKKSPDYDLSVWNEESLSWYNYKVLIALQFTK